MISKVMEILSKEQATSLFESAALNHRQGFAESR